jgi:LuxR family transcriptional regulator, maltose regulon positive regulatory protein
LVFTIFLDYLTKATQETIGVWDEVRAKAFVAEIARRQGKLNRSMVDSFIELLNNVQHDQPLKVDVTLLSGLYEECIRRHWYADRFSEILSYKPEIANPPKLEISTFGYLEVKLEGEFIHSPLKKSTELLVWLILHGPATRSEIISVLWNKKFTTKDMEYFKVAARRLRTALSEHPSITFNPLPFEHGVYRIAEQFDLHLDIAPLISDTPDSSADILALLESYKGEFLPGFQGEWIENIRTRALDTLLERGLELGQQLEQLDPKDAIRVYDRIRALDSLCEPAYQGLERVYRTLGQEANAVDTANAWQKALRS